MSEFDNIPERVRKITRGYPGDQRTVLGLHELMDEVVALTESDSIRNQNIALTVAVLTLKYQQAMNALVLIKDIETIEQARQLAATMLKPQPS